MLGLDVSALRQDLIGQQFERLLVISETGRDKNRQSHWLCRCECGVEKVVSGNNLRKGNTKSCGCLKLQLIVERQTTHGQTNSLAYRSYLSAKDRCTNPSNPEYEHYGGRGILFCFENFEEFFAYMGPRPNKKYSLDRINNKGNYEPGNLRWATRKTQNRNMRSNRLITYQNETLCIAEWAEKLRLNHEAIRGRLKLGWSVEKTLSTPIRARAK